MTFLGFTGWIAAYLIVAGLVAWPVDVLVRKNGMTRFWTFGIFCHPAIVVFFVWCLAYPNKWDEFMEVQNDGR